MNEMPVQVLFPKNCNIQRLKGQSSCEKPTLCVCAHSVVFSSFVNPSTIAHLALLSMEFSKQEFWSELLFPPPRNLPDPGIKPISLVSLALAGGFFNTSTTWEACGLVLVIVKSLPKFFSKKNFCYYFPRTCNKTSLQV